MGVENDKPHRTGCRRKPPSQPATHGALMHPTQSNQTQRHTRNQSTGAAIVCACMAWGLMALSINAQAAPQKSATQASADAPAKKKGSVKVKHQRSSSEESTSERDRRLYRECKGLPNAGACLGYTRR